mmetsp:Transcript_14256/g.33261  ORF Transcript_14256/g.33261 Transcript_14256/m.33261 type:complete len:128 (-) Transcript_14256:1808-2191(-)
MPPSIGSGRDTSQLHSRQNDKEKLAIDYEEYGFAGPIDVLSQTEVAQTLRDVKDELSKDDGSRFKLHLILPSVEKIVHNSILLDAVRQALGTSHDILLSFRRQCQECENARFLCCSPRLCVCRATTV